MRIGGKLFYSPVELLQKAMDEFEKVNSGAKAILKMIKLMYVHSCGVGQRVPSSVFVALFLDALYSVQEDSWKKMSVSNILVRIADNAFQKRSANVRVELPLGLSDNVWEWTSDDRFDALVEFLRLLATKSSEGIILDLQRLDVGVGINSKRSKNIESGLVSKASAAFSHRVIATVPATENIERNPEKDVSYLFFPTLSA